MSNSNGSLKLVSGCSLSLCDLCFPLFDGGFGVYIGGSGRGFGKTQIRVDAYFALKKIEIDWTPKRARLAGPRTPGRPAWALSGPFQSHLLRVASSSYSSS